MPTMTPARATAEPTPGPVCADDPELMFPLVESERPWRPTPAEVAAQAVCARCPVLARCRREVLETDSMPYGVAGGLTAADRRAVRATRRGLGGPATPSPGIGGQDEEEAPGAVPAPLPSSRPGDLETAIAQVMAVHARREHGADPVKVRELALERGPATASRWEVALAALALLTRGMKVGPVARVLGENYTQVARWRDRHAAGEAPVRGGPGTGTGQVARPAALVTKRPHQVTVDERGAA